MNLFQGLVVGCFVALTLSACQQGNRKLTISKEKLGEQLFNEKALSKDGTQSCATCHNSKHAFIDTGINLTSIDKNIPGAVSLGQDDLTLGDINTPTITYAAFVPDFHFDKEEELFKGGMFLNGRALNLTEQAKQPLISSVEMQNTKESVVSTVKTKYGEPMKVIYGHNIFSTTEEAYNAIADSIAAFQKTDQFSSFDSKFDRVLRGETEFTAEEKRGHDLFVAEDKGNCAACHPVPTLKSSKVDSLFTDFTYDNLGVPKNHLVRCKNGKEEGFIDNGLFNNPNVTDESLKGAFRVPTLRNVAVTAPYMHNGVFRDLSTVVHFYNSRDVKEARNPETQQPWEPGEVESTKNTEELGNLGLSNDEVDAIVAFMRTLTDARYEELMPTK